jgi:MSHA pilin protein MshC
MQPVCTTRRRNGHTLGAGASRGYTLVELVTVIVILGILAAIAVPRFADNQVFEERGFYEEVVAALRYGQKIAVGSGCPVQISIDANGYALAQQTVLANRCDPGDNSYAVPVLLPDGQAAAGSTPAGVILGPVVTYEFDGLGQTDLGSDLTVSVGSLSLIVQAQSGYVLTP